MKRILFLCMFALAATAAHAQFKINLQGLNDLTLELNDINQTATICCYDAQIQDQQEKERPRSKKNGMYVKWRWVTTFVKSAPETLIIPATWTHPQTGKVYTITAIGDAAFAGVKRVSYVLIPNTVKEIGRYAFFGSSLVSVNLPASVTSIGDRAFGFCPSLRSLRMSKQAKLGSDLYTESTKIKLITYHPGVEENLASNDKNGQDVPAPVVESDVDVNISSSARRNEETFAMIIANEVYHAGVSNVQFAIHDGQVFKEYCEKTLGLNPNHIYYEENATLGKMNGLIDRLLTAAEAFEGDAKFIVYYAGHGIPDETTSEAYLLPTDGNGQNLKTAFRLKDFYDQLGALNAKDVTVFIDACFSGAQRDGGMLASARGVAIAPHHVAPEQGNTVIFSAASGNETAWPYREKGHGLFTYYLLKKLQDSKGEVTLGELDAYIQQKVKRTIVDLPYAKKQTPKTDISPRLSNSWQRLKLK